MTDSLGERRLWGCVHLARAHMRAAYVDELSPPERIQVGQMTAPLRAADEVPVRLEVTAFNPDAPIRSGRYRIKI